MTQDNRRQQTKKRLELALVALLKKQPFTAISTSQLTEQAGISRSAFYTHYKDKYEMIDLYQQALFHKIEYIFDRTAGNMSKTFLELFEFLEREELIAALLSENGTSEIQQFLRYKLKQLIASIRSNRTQFSKTELDYLDIYWSHAFFGVCQNWIAHGKRESPSEMTELLIKIMSTTPRE